MALASQHLIDRIMLYCGGYARAVIASVNAELVTPEEVENAIINFINSGDLSQTELDEIIANAGEAFPNLVDGWTPESGFPIPNINPSPIVEQARQAADDAAAEKINAAGFADDAEGFAQEAKMARDELQGILTGTEGAKVVKFDPTRTDYDAGSVGAILKQMLVPTELLIGVHQPDTVAPTNRQILQDYIDLAVTTGSTVYIPGGIIKIQPGLKIPAGARIKGGGTDRFDRLSSLLFGFDHGTHLLLTGTPHETVQVWGITNMSVYGGYIQNPDHRGAGFNDDYSLYDFTNADATGTTPATLKNLSYGMLLEQAHGCSIEDLRIVPEFRGIDGYYDKTTMELGNNVDFGLLNINSQDIYIKNVQPFGHFRAAGMAQVLSNKTPDESIATTFNKYHDVTTSGFVGFMIRGLDVAKVTAKTANTVEIPWWPSCFWDPNGGTITPSAGAAQTYTGLSRNGDKLVFTGVSNTNGFTVGGELFPASSFGSSFTNIYNLFSHGISHTCGMPACMLGFPHNSEALQISGYPNRDVKLYTYKGHDRDVWIHLHDATDVTIYSGNGEAPQTSSTPGGPMNLPRCARAIAAPGTSSTAWFGTYAAGGSDLTLIGTRVSTLVDMYPAFERSAPAISKFPSGIGLFRPGGLQGSPIGQLAASRTNGWRTFAQGYQIYTEGTGSNNRIQFRNKNDGFLMIDLAPDTDNGPTVARGWTSGSILVPAGGVGEIVPWKAGGQVMIKAENGISAPLVHHGGIVDFDVGTTPEISRFGGGMYFDVVQTDVTGTTGAVGKTTVGVVEGKLRIENGTTAQIRYRYFWINF